MQSISKLSATARMCVKENSYFGFVELMGQYVLRAAELLAMLMIWRALFSRGANSEGMTLSQMLSYTALSSAISPLLSVHTPASSWLHDGTMLSLYLRPASLFGQLMAHTMGGWIMPLCIYGTPVIAVSLFCGLNMTPATSWFYLSLPLSVAQGFAVDFLFAALLIRMKNLEWTMHSIRGALTALLTGAVIPFAVLPWGIGEYLALSPFGTLAGAPLALFVGLDSPARLITAQIFWTLTLWPIAIWAYAASRERLVSYGG